MIKPSQIKAKVKPQEGVPFLRIIKEHVIDMVLGGFITLWVVNFFEIGGGGFLKGSLSSVKELGGLGAIGSFIALFHRIYFNGKKK